jgi:hypothetical protein
MSFQILVKVSAEWQNFFSLLFPLFFAADEKIIKRKNNLQNK